MDELLEYMTRTESALAELGSRVKALESAMVQHTPGASMESDHSKLPVVIVDNSAAPVEVIPHAGD